MAMACCLSKQINASAIQVDVDTGAPRPALGKEVAEIKRNLHKH